MALIIAAFAGERGFFLRNIVKLFLIIIGINLSLCTLKRVKTLPKPVLIMHIGGILTLIGCGVSSFGFVATVNIYEGTRVDKAYRWDLKKDVSLGMDLTVKKINEEFYPVPVKIGVLKEGKKVGLFTLKTGENFGLENYRVKIEAPEFPLESLRLSVFNNDDYIGYADTSGERNLPSDFPFEFKLVAYKAPIVKRSWVDLRLSRGSEIIAEGSSEVNSPFKWEGLSFYHTATNLDKYGIPFAGIQITRDLGTPYVFLGFGVIAFGGTYYLWRRLRRLR